MGVMKDDRNVTDLDTDNSIWKISPIERVKLHRHLCSTLPRGCRQSHRSAIQVPYIGVFPPSSVDYHMNNISTWPFH